jgi:hypothetical protein
MYVLCVLYSKYKERSMEKVLRGNKRRTSEKTIPVDPIFSAPVQTGPGAHPASCTMGTESFTGIKRPGRGVNHPPAYSAEVKERVELYLYSLPGPSWSVLG